MTVFNLDFTNEFLAYDFDKILLETNNPLINSHKYYLIFKQEYIKTTKLNLQKYKNLVNELDKISNNKFKQPDETTYIYSYVNKDRENELKHEIKTIVLNQRTHIKKLIEHVNKLNVDMVKLSSETTYKNSKNILSTLLETKRKSKSNKIKYKRTITK